MSPRSTPTGDSSDGRDAHGIGFLTVITASVTASLIESSRGRFAESVRELARQLQAVSERLVTIEALLAQPTPSELSDGVS